MEALLVPDDLDSHREASSMIPAMKHLPERPLAKGADHLVTISKMIAVNDEIVAPLVIIAMIVRWVVSGGGLLLAASANAEDLRII